MSSQTTPLQSYLFNLYSYNNELIGSSPLVYTSNTKFLDNDWIDITATDGVVSFTEGIELLDNDFTLKIWIKHIPIDKTFIKILGANGNIQLKYYNNRFHCFKTSNGITSHYVNINDMNIGINNIVCIMLRQLNNAFDVYAETLK